MSRERNLVMEIHVAGRTFYAEKEILTLIGDEAKILDAYFAEKKIKNVEETAGTHTYTFANTNDTSTAFKKNKIASVILSKVNKDERSNQKYTTQALVRAQLTLGSYTVGNTITVDLLKSVEQISFPKITSAPMGYQVYLIAETQNLKDKKVKLKIHEKESDLKLLKTKDDVLPVLVFAKKEDATTDTEISDWMEIDVKEENGKKEGGAVVLHKEDKGDKIEVGIKKIQLRPKKDKIKTEGEDAALSFEGWQEALYIREDETDEGKKAIKDAENQKTARNAETFKTLTFDDTAEKKIYPTGKINAPKTAVIGKEIEYILDIENTTEATEEDKNNIRWSFYVQGESKTDKKSTYIETKSKKGLYTYAKMELVDCKNKLTIVFDEALIGKKVQIEPFRESPGLSTSPDYVRTTSVQEAPTPKIAKRETTSIWLTSQCDSIENAGEIIDKEFKNYFKLIPPDTIHIYHDGHISKLNFEALTKVKYRYHTDLGNTYEIATCDLFEIDERLKGESDDRTTAHTVESGYDENNIVTYSHAASRKKYSYPDGTIRTYGEFNNPDKGTSHRLVTYKKGAAKLLVIRMPDGLNKKIGDKKIVYSFTKTQRKYCGPEQFAGFIGALVDFKYSIKSGGSCEKDGTSYPSVSHVNGQSVDTNYLGDNTKDQEFINAMHKFGFKSILRGSKKKVFTNTSNGGKLHNNHLHSGGFVGKHK